MVSVIIPTYKRSEYIERAIESVLNQTYSNFEIIVVDDNDSNTIYRAELEKKMQRYKNDSRIRYIKHEKNMNGATARNTGIKIASGEYITFLDDDDIFLTRRLEILTEALEKHPEYGAAYSSTIVIKGKKIIGYAIASESGRKRDELLLDEFSFGTGSNMFFRAEVLKELNGFDVSFERHQDIEIMVRFFRKYSILAVEEALVVKFEDDRINSPSSVEKYLKIKNHFIEKFETDIEQLGIKQCEFYKRQFMMILVMAIKNKEYSYEKEIKNIICKYSNISFKDNIKLLIYHINNFIPIEKIKYKYIAHKAIKSINQETKKELEKVLNAN